MSALESAALPRPRTGFRATGRTLLLLILVLLAVLLALGLGSVNILPAE